MTDSNFNHSKHKKYTLISNEENFCWVQNVENGHTNRCFCMNHQIGDEFWLFEKSINPHNGNISFEYSVLNVYESDKYYEFNIVRETEKYLLISNFPHLTFAAPIHFREDDTALTINLFVKKIDLEKNKLVFSKDNTEKSTVSEYYENDLSAFEMDKIYSLPLVNSYINKNGNRFLQVEYQEKIYHINVPEKFRDEHFEGNIECQLGYYTEGDRYSLKLTRYTLISAKYKIGNRYSFVLQSISTAYSSSSQCWILRDSNGYTNHYYPDSDLSKDREFPPMKEGDTIELFVWKITDKGYLSLSQNATIVRTSKYFIEDIFEQIGYSGQEKELFFDFGKEQLENSNPDEETPSFLEQYNKGENLWLFTYFAYLDEKISQYIVKEEYSSVQILLDVYLKMERWLIYTSDYLKNFMPYRAGIIIEKAETKIELLEAQREALEYIHSGEWVQYLENILSQLHNTRYLPKNKKNIFKSLLKSVNILESKESRELIYNILFLLCKNNLLADHERFYIGKVIDNKLVSVRNKLLEISPTDEYCREEMRAVLPFQYLLVALAQNDTDSHYPLFSSVTLFRYLSIYHQDMRYLKLAIQMIVKKGILSLNLFLYDDIFSIDFEKMHSMVSFPNFTARYYAGKGRIIQSEEYFMMIPQNHFNRKMIDFSHTVLQLEDGIAVSSSYFDEKMDYSLTKEKLAGRIYEFLNFLKSKTDKFQNFKEGNEYMGQVKLVDNDFFCFLQSKLGEEYAEPLLHINGFNRGNFFGDMRKYLYPSDYIRYFVEEIQGNKMNINCFQMLSEHAEQHLKHPKLVKGIVVFRNEDTTSVITEEGWPVLLKNQVYPVDTLLKMEVFDFDEEETAFIASNVFPITESWTAGNPIDLYRSYLQEANVLISTISDESKLTENAIPVENDFRKIALLLLNTLEQYRGFITDEKENLGYLLAQIVLAGIIKNSRSYQYYAELEQIINRKNEEQQREWEDLGREAVALIARLEQPKEELSIQNEKLEQLKGLIEAYHITLKYGENNEIKKQFIRLIMNELELIGLLRNEKFIDELRKIQYFYDISQCQYVEINTDSVQSTVEEKLASSDERGNSAYGDIKSFDLQENKSYGDLNLFIFDDDTYMISKNEFTDYDFKAVLPSGVNNAYLLLCYDDGCVNKVNINIFSDKNLNRKYKNIINGQSNIVRILVAQENSEMVITTHKSGMSYAKILRVDAISTNKLLNLRGSNVVKSDFDEIIRYDIKNNLNADYDVFRKGYQSELGAIVSENEMLYQKLFTER